MKIRNAIFGVYVAVSGVGFSVLLGFLLLDVRPRYVDSVEHTLQDSARAIAAVAGRQPSVQPTALGPLNADSGVLRVEIADAAGRIVYDSSGRGGAALPAGGPPVLSAREPIRRDGREAGWVQVSRQIETINTFVWSERQKLGTLAVSVAGVMLVVGWWVAAWVAQSLERLTAYAEAVRDGRPARPPQSPAAEISTLSRAFEEMRTTIEGKAYVERYTEAFTHEIKTPLASIRGASEVLGGDLAPADRERFLANIRAEVDRIKSIVDRMLELSSVETRRGRIEMTLLDLRAIAQDALDGAAGAAAAKSVVLALRPGSSCFVRGERFLLTRALANLVQNAVEFTPGGGKVELAVTADQALTRVLVEDSGPGIPDFALPRLFDRFYSLPRPATGRKSSGLGLTIVREIVRLHGGEVTLETGRRRRPGRVELPLAASEVQHSA